MGWQTEARKAGFNPKRVVDTPYSFGKLELTVTMDDMKGAVIGDGCNCSGARAIKRALDADWAHVGASVGHIVPKGSKRILRFIVNGLAIRQDATMNVVGEKLILRAPPKSQRRAAYRARIASPHSKTDAKEGSGRTRSLAASLRG